MCKEKIIEYRMYRDIDDNGECITIYSGKKCQGCFLEDDIEVKRLEKMGVEILEGLDNRS